MPIVLITGINGFVAVHTAVLYLSKGWTVRGTIRSQSKGEKILTLPAIAPYVKQGKFETVVVEDLEKGDFTKALEGVEVIAHCASPWTLTGKSWEEYRGPAVNGTTNILEQAARVPSVKAVGIVSSFAAIADMNTQYYEQDGKVYTEKDWQPWTEEHCKGAEEGFKAGNPMMLQVAPFMWYAASKKYAELAATETHKRVNASYSLASINPPMIFGPTIHYGPGSTPDDIKNADISTAGHFATFAAGKDSKVHGIVIPVWSDVRNVAEALYEATNQRKTERYVICNGQCDFQTMAIIARKKFPQFEAHIPFVSDDEPKPLAKGSYKLDGSKAEKELGIKYTSLETLTEDVVKQFEVLGLYKK